MIAEEIIHNISMKNFRGNAAIKLDMAKAYNKLSWNFLKKVLRRLGFNNVLIDLI